MLTAPHKKRKPAARPAKKLAATNQDWRHSGAALIGYDSRGDEQVLAVLPLQQTRVVASRVVGDSAVVALTETGLFLKFQCKTPSLKQPAFDLTLETKSVLGSGTHFTPDSVVLSRDGSVAFVSNLGGIRAVSAGGETVERVENEVVCGTAR